MALTFSQRHRVAGNKSVEKLHGADQMCVLVDYVKEMASKKSCKCGEFGSFEYLLFLLCCLPFVSPSFNLLPDYRFEVTLPADWSLNTNNWLGSFVLSHSSPSLLSWIFFFFFFLRLVWKM